MIIYIAGYGRSGSTILDIKLGKYFGFLSLGEVSSIYSEISIGINAKCGCGQTYDKCELWSELSCLNEQQLTKRKLILDIYQSPFPINILSYFIYRIKFKHMQKNCFKKAIAKPFDLAESKFPRSVYVDSSKTAIKCAKRPLLLHSLGFDIIVIHIKRPLFNVIKSVRKGDNHFLSGKTKKKKKFRVPRAIISYIIANHYAKLTKRELPYIYVSQTDLKYREEEVLNKIERFIKSNFKKRYIQYQDSHIAGGNRLKEHEVVNTL